MFSPLSVAQLLGPDKGGVGPVFFHELLVSAQLHNAPVLDDGNAVGVSDSG